MCRPLSGAGGGEFIVVSGTIGPLDATGDASRKLHWLRWLRFRPGVRIESLGVGSRVNRLGRRS